VGDAEFYVPYKGQISEKDFVKFSKEPNILFQKDVSKLHLYK
jgi:mannan endo-1,4-beta-mannosidase